MFSKKILQGALLIFLILVLVSVLVLLFINKDLDVKAELKEDSLELKMTNTQNHIITNIFVTLNGEKGENFSLNPGEQKTVNITLAKGKNILEVNAAGVQKFYKEVDLKDFKGFNYLNFNISYKELKKDISTEIMLSICNTGDDIGLTTEVYKNEGFEINDTEKTKIIEKDKCEDFSFIIIPKLQGTNKIFFHIFNEANNIDEEINFDLKVS
ncbi:MAG: hypothetical protein PHH82_02875 [Candidatus ainarchaeum sp.]|nr:hypothetical protein [Candidatus ainarchaeum sp.]